MTKRPQHGESLQPVAQVVAQTLRQTGLERVLLLARLTQRWQDIVGAQLAAVTHPEGVRGRVLFVTVADAIWLQQLTFYQAQLLGNIRRVLGDVPIGKLHFALASPSQAPPQERDAGPAWLPLTAAEEHQIREDTAAIMDADLREAVQRAWRRGWQSRRYVV